MLISIVIPAHNRPAFLLEAVHSIAEQTYPNFEVIVIDDGSDPPVSQLALEEVLGKSFHSLQARYSKRCSCGEERWN